MKLRSTCLLLCAVTLSIVFGSIAFAAITAEQKKQIDEIKKDLGKVQGLITKKETDDAEKILNESEQKLKEIAKESGVEETKLPFAPLLKQIEQRRTAMAKGKKGGGADAGGFEKDVAPILTARCLGCHDDTARGGLQVDTFAGIVKGGQGGRFVVPGNPNASLLIQRINATGQQRMPRGGNALTADEIKKITAWVAGGAKYAGDNNAPISTLSANNTAATPVEINKATGKETVSFSKDIAPWMVNLCVNCHSGNTPRSGFSLETFEKLMRGGSSGRVVLPGNTKDSRLWHLVGEQDPIKMPPGQALITRTNWNNLKTWIEEGAKFDGNDAKAQLRTLVPTDAELRAKELAALTPEDLTKRHKEGAAELWKKALSKEPALEAETDEFIVYGNVGEGRLKDIGGWAEDNAKMLKRVFGIKDGQIWKGKLIIFVFKERFGYEEFVRTNENTEIPPEAKGHSRVVSVLDNPYICLQDIGDTPDDDNPGLKVLLLNHLTEGLLQRSTTKVPDWVARGTGLALAAKSDPKNPYFKGLSLSAKNIVATLQRPQDVFSNGTFSSGDLGPVGYTLVTFIISQSDEGKYVQFLGQLMSGKNLNEALRAVFAADQNNLALSYLNSIGSAKPAKKGKK